MQLALTDTPDVLAFAALLSEVDPSLSTTVLSREALIAAAAAPHAWRIAAVSADPWLVRRLRAADPALPIVAVTPAADVRLAAELTEAGASDLLVLGDRPHERVRTLLTRLAPWLALREENRRLRTESGARWALIGESQLVMSLRGQIDRVARIPRPVLVQGERGTGKELVARALHVASRVRGALVVVNCAALPDALLESELFGHEKGAFTGADHRSEGRFTQADGGTLFLDEIGSMSIAFQQKILRVVEYGEFQRVGGNAPLGTKARVIAATNADLLARVAEGSFLADLYDRLSFEVIRVPPLRERRDDIPVLAQWFLEAFQSEVSSLPRRTLGPDALAALHAWSFPGNVRELKHVVERAAYHPGPPEITAQELGLGAAPTGEGGFEAQVTAFKCQLLRNALDRAGGNQAAAARLLGLSYDQLRWYRRTLLGSA